MSQFCQFCGNHPKIMTRCYNCDLYMCKTCTGSIHSKIHGVRKHITEKLNNFGTQRKISKFSFLNCCRYNWSSDLVGINMKHECQPMTNLEFCLSGSNRTNRHSINVNFSKERKYVKLPNSTKQSRKEEEMLDTYRPDNEKMFILKCFTTDIPVVSRLLRCPDGTLWITRASTNTLETVIAENGNCLKTVRKFEIKAFDITRTPTGDILIASTDSTLKIVENGYHKMRFSIFDVSPFLPTSVHVSRYGKIIIGVMSAGAAFPITGERKLILMNIKGICEDIIEYDEQSRVLFSYLYSICSDDRDYIYVLDRIDVDCAGRVIILNQHRSVSTIYTGHPIFNTDRKFKPKDIAVSLSGTIIISETHMHILHVLDRQSCLIQYINTREILAILYPQSLDCSYKDQLIIGTSRRKGAIENSKLYYVTFTALKPLHQSDVETLKY